MDERKHTCIVFCDISKAFDRVWHTGLLFKLRQNGVDGNLHGWFGNYLSNRSQKVFVGSSFSENKVISAGVPQGSVLGPLLFCYMLMILLTILSVQPDFLPMIPLLQFRHQT